MTTRRGVIEIDVGELLRSADHLARLTGGQLGQAGLNAVNEVAPRMERRAREAIGAGINLAEAYISARMGVRLGDDPGRPEAVIFAPFRHTPLGRYDPKQITATAKRPKRAKGDKSRGVPAGHKAAGVSVEVTRGARKVIAHGFLMPLRNGNGIGVFTRSRGSLRYQHRLGPSVYQLFRVQADLLADESSTELQLAVLAEAERALEGVFE